MRNASIVDIIGTSTPNHEPRNACPVINMPNRYYCPDLISQQQENRVTLKGTEAHHLINVMRQHVGDQIELFDGTGTCAKAIITYYKKSYVDLEITNLEQIDPQQEQSGITIAAVSPKGERYRWLIEKLTELGVDHYIPLTTERSVVSPGSGKIEKMQQIVIVAMKQSKRLIEMTLSDPVNWNDLFAQPATDQMPEQTLLVADPAGENLASCNMDQQHKDQRHKLLICIGPEGGFTDAERQAAQKAGARLISLGPSILRTETAAIAAAAYFRLSNL